MFCDKNETVLNFFAPVTYVEHVVLPNIRKEKSERQIQRGLIQTAGPLVDNKTERRYERQRYWLASAVAISRLHG